MWSVGIYSNLEDYGIVLVVRLVRVHDRVERHELRVAPVVLLWIEIVRDLTLMIGHALLLRFQSKSRL